MEDQTTKPTYQETMKQFVAQVRTSFTQLSGEITERNQKVEDRDGYIYGDYLTRSLSIPIGHDKTEVNWLKRTVEIHGNMFMSRGFQVISTYDSENPENAADDKDKQRIQIENAKSKEYAEQRKKLIDAIIYDNGGASLWADLAQNASAVGTSAVKTYYDEAKKKLVISQIESIENLYVLWTKNDFRSADAFAYAYQVSKQTAIRDYKADEDVATSPAGQPFGLVAAPTQAAIYSNQPMVSVIEVTGMIEGWAAEKGRLKQVSVGKETPINCMIIGDKVTRLITDEKKLPRYWIFPNKRARKRAWGISDISDAAIAINQTYIETLSDWRTHASKVNFQKYKAYGFGPDTQLPKSQTRRVQMLPLAEGQDIQRLDQGDSNGQDFLQQMNELKEQFVRETGISRVLFDDPSVTLNSNQALMTSMKPTSDIAEAKKQLWSPILTEMFEDALETVAAYNKELQEIIDSEDDWTLKVMWPSVMQKEDPVYQSMLLNRFNANTMSLQSFLEAQGESKEEIDRIRDELSNPVTAAILGRIVNVMAQNVVMPQDPNAQPQPKVSVNLRGDLTPNQEANLATQQGFNSGPFPASAGPQGNQGMIAQENVDNQGFLSGDPFKGGQPIYKGPDGQPLEQQSAPAQVNTQANNTEGAGIMSQPGSGASTTSPEGAVAQQQQNQGN